MRTLSFAGWAKTELILLDFPSGELCQRSYPGHPKGCPNYGKRASCPPQAPHISEIIDLGKEVYAIWNKYEFGVHVENMRKRHPDWSQRQLECCLYWQGSARKKLRSMIDLFVEKNPHHTHILQIPESHGVNVTATMKTLGIDLEWPPKEYVYQVAIAGSR